MTKKIIPILLLLTTFLFFFSCSMDGLPMETADVDLENSIDNNEESASRGARSVINTGYAKEKIGAYLTKYFKSYLKYNKHGAYINMQGQGNTGSKMVSTSEAMGYGMRLALYEMNINMSNKTKALDSYRKFMYLSNMMSKFMFTNKDNTSGSGLQYKSANWYIPKSFDWKTVENDKKEAGPATDGDMDIAYAYVLAEKMQSNFWKKYSNTLSIGHKKSLASLRWRNKQYALELIRGIAINYLGTATVKGKTRHYLQIAPPDWAAAKKLTRPSDWMPLHLQAFYNYYSKFGPSKYKRWYLNRIGKMLDGTLEMITENKWGKGFFPDFIIFENNGYRALKESDSIFDALGEDIVPNHYSWNACRIPWRLVEYIKFYANKNSISENVVRIVNKMRGGVSRDLAKIGSGYSVGSSKKFSTDWRKEDSKYSTAFAAPMGASILGMKTNVIYASLVIKYKTDKIKSNFKFLIKKFKGPSNIEEEHGYYEDSINAFALLLLADLMPKE